MRAGLQPVDQYKDGLFGSAPLHFGSPTQLLEQMFVASMSIQSTAKDRARVELEYSARAAASAGTAELATLAGGAAATPLAMPVAPPQYLEAHVAAVSGDVEDLREMIEDEDEGVLAQDHLGNTPLTYACTDGTSLSAVRLLVEHGSTINGQNFEGKTALHGAASSDDQVRVVTELLNCGANPNIADLDGATPLHAAVANGAGEAAVELLRRGAWVDAQDLEGDTPLAYAVRGDDASLCRLLLAAGADAHHQNEDGESPLELAALSTPDILEMLSR